MIRRALLFAALLAGCASDPWDGLTDAELCGSGELGVALSPAPQRARGNGTTLAFPAHVKAVGEHLPGAWADFLDDLHLAEDDGADFTITFRDAAALASAKARCGATSKDDPDAYLLVTGARGVTIAGSRTGAARALSTLAELAASGTAPGASIFDAPLVRKRPVMEGFYGRAWDDTTRKDVVRRAARLRMNTFVRAPKADLLSTFLWFQPYPDDVLAGAAEVAAYAKDRGIDFCWEVLPGGNVTYSDPAQLALLNAKYDALYDAGVRCLVLAFDDVSQALSEADKATGRSYAALQLAFVEAVAAHLATKAEPVELAVVPNDYTTKDMRADAAYIAALATLPPAVALGWTGTDVVPETVTVADVDEVTRLLARPPLLVDNYPVGNPGDDAGPLHLRPITGREKGIFPKLETYGGNTMVQARASFVALASLAELAWNPEAYDAERAWTRGIEVAARGENPALRLLADLSEGLDLTGDAAAPGLRAALAAYAADPAAGRAPLVAMLSALRDVDQTVGANDAALAAELAPWTKKARGWATLALDLVAAQEAAGGRATDDEVAAFRARLAALKSQPAVLADAVFEAFVAASLVRLGGG